MFQPRTESQPRRNLNLSAVSIWVGGLGAQRCEENSCASCFPASSTCKGRKPARSPPSSTWPGEGASWPWPWPSENPLRLAGGERARETGGSKMLVPTKRGLRLCPRRTLEESRGPTRASSSTQADPEGGKSSTPTGGGGVRKKEGGAPHLTGEMKNSVVEVAGQLTPEARSRLTFSFQDPGDEKRYVLAAGRLSCRRSGRLEKSLPPSSRRSCQNRGKTPRAGPPFRAKERKETDDTITFTARR